MKNIVSLFYLGIIAMLLVSCSTPEEQFIRNLSDFTADLEENVDYYTVSDWPVLAEEFYALMETANGLQFTDEQLREIRRLEGRCLVSLGKNVGTQIKQSVDVLESIGIGVVQGILETLEE